MGIETRSPINHEEKQMATNRHGTNWTHLIICVILLAAAWWADHEHHRRMIGAARDELAAFRRTAVRLHEEGGECGRLALALRGELAVNEAKIAALRMDLDQARAEAVACRNDEDGWLATITEAHRLLGICQAERGGSGLDTPASTSVPSEEGGGAAGGRSR
jgi:hypothetical protein